MPNLSLIKPTVQVNPDVDPFLVLTPAPLDGPTQASVMRSQQAQRAEREAVIASRLEADGEDLTRQQLVDSVATDRVFKAMPTDLALLDRRDASAVAVRLHDPRWQQISRYYAADAIFVELRSFFAAGHGYATDSDLRELADRLAGTAHVKRYMVWTGQITVTARDWARAALGLFSIREDR